MTGEQYARLWEGLNRLHFFRTDERPDVPVGYAVLSLCWHESHMGTSTNDEGGKVEAVYRTRERADEEVQKLGRNGACSWHPSGADLFDPETYWQIATDGGPSGDIVAIEIESANPSGDQTIFLVVRSTELNYRSEERVPVAGFARRERAELLCNEEDAAFRIDHEAWDLYPDGDSEEYNALFAAAKRVKLTRMRSPSWQWWKELKAPPTPEQRAALWGAVPGKKLYEVIETKLRD
jgi:hypothetical protein